MEKILFGAIKYPAGIQRVAIKVINADKAVEELGDERANCFFKQLGATVDNVDYPQCLPTRIVGENLDLAFYFDHFGQDVYGNVTAYYNYVKGAVSNDADGSGMLGGFMQGRGDGKTFRIGDVISDGGRLFIRTKEGINATADGRVGAPSSSFCRLATPAERDRFFEELKMNNLDYDDRDGRLVKYTQR